MEKLLSTPHGALGTFFKTRPNPTQEALSTPHGALGTANALSKCSSRSGHFQLHTVH